MTDKNILENAITDIDDHFIEEALATNPSSHKKNIFIFGGHLTKAAIACIAVFGAAAIGISAYATVHHLQSTKIEDNIVYVGGGPINDIVADIKEYQNSTEGQEAPDFDYKIKSVETGDGSTLWTQKEVRKYSNDQYTVYTYNNYEDAVTDHDMEVWFTNLPGEPSAVYVSYSDDSFFERTHLEAEYNYNNGSYIITTYRLTAIKGTISPEYGIFYVYDETSNIRTYTNANGVTFTLVDGTNYDPSTGEAKKETNVLILNDNTENIAPEIAFAYSGELIFHGLTDKEIHKVLDCFDK